MKNEQFGDLTPEEIDRLTKFKQERKEEEQYPREYFRLLAADFLQIGDLLCAVYSLPQEGPLSALGDSLHDKEWDLHAVTSAKALMATLRTGETLQEFVLRRDTEVLKETYGDTVELGLMGDALFTKGLGIVGANFIHIPVYQEELITIDMRDALRITNSIAVSYALNLGFIPREYPTIEAAGERLTIPEQIAGYPLEPITIRHPKKPLVLDVNLFDAGVFDYNGIQEYPWNKFAVEGIVVRYHQA